MPRNFVTSVVSLSNVRSVEMDFRSWYLITGVLSMPFAFLQMALPCFPNTRDIISTGISCTVLILLIPKSHKVLYVFSPTMGILRTDRGAKNGFSVPVKIRSSLLGFASPVAILETVLLAESPKEMGNPVSRMIFERNSEAS